MKISCHIYKNPQLPTLSYGHKKNLKIIYEDFRILKESWSSFTLPSIADDDLETLHLEKGIEALQKWAHESIDNLETTPLASSQGTSNLPNCIAKFNAIEANLMAIKLYFIKFMNLEMKFHH